MSTNFEIRDADLGTKSLYDIHKHCVLGLELTMQKKERYTKIVEGLKLILSDQITSALDKVKDGFSRKEQKLFENSRLLSIIQQNHFEILVASKDELELIYTSIRDIEYKNKLNTLASAGHYYLNQEAYVDMAFEEATALGYEIDLGLSDKLVS